MNSDQEQARAREAVAHALDAFRPVGPNQLWGERAAIDCATKELRERFEQARCDSPAVSDCTRCKVMYIVRKVERVAAYVDTLPTPTAHVEAVRALLADERGAMIETALRDIMSHVGDAIARLGPNDRLYAANRVQLQKAIGEGWKAINLPEPDRRAQIAALSSTTDAGEETIPDEQIDAAIAHGFGERFVEACDTTDAGEAAIPTNGAVSTDEIRRILAVRAFDYAGTRNSTGLRPWCEANSVVQSHANEFANGKRDPTNDLLKALGFRWAVVANREVAYTPKPAASPVSSHRGEMEAENARLREALEPFAALADEWDRWQAKGSTSTPRMIRMSYGRVRFGLAEYQAARTALSNPIGGGE